MARQALFMALSDKAEKNIYVLDDLKIEKTKEMAEILKNLKVNGTVLLILPKNEPKTVRAARNIRGLSVLEANKLNALDLLSVKNLVLTKDSLKTIKETFAK
jgi:large subunit ribosomal protein L4